jgi:hypothetical protein
MYVYRSYIAMLDKAVDHLLDALRFEVCSPYVWHSMALICGKTGKHEKAAAYMLKFASLSVYLG